MKKTKESLQTEVIIVPQAPAIEPGFVNLSMTKEELLTFMNLLNITTQTFENLAMQAIQQNDQNSYTVLSARQKISKFYADKLVQFYKMPEPESRNIH